MDCSNNEIQRVDKIKCDNPMFFFSCWLSIGAWCVLCINNDFGDGDYQLVIDSFGFCAFIATFLMMVISFGSDSGKKRFICNVYDSLKKNWKRITKTEILLLGSSFLLVPCLGALPLWRIYLLKHICSGSDFKAAMNASVILSLFLVIGMIWGIVHFANKVSKLFMDSYTGRLIQLGTDIVLMLHLFFLIACCGILYANILFIRILVMVLVARFLYNLFKIYKH